MNRIEKLEQFLEEWKNEERWQWGVSSYHRSKEWLNPDNNYEEIDFEIELETLLLSLDFTFAYSCVGYFDSPGYDASYYCLSIFEDGQIKQYPIVYECY